MRRFFTQLSEIAWRSDDPFTEVVLPDAIDHHSGSKGIVRRSNPFRQAAPPPARLASLRRRRKFVLLLPDHGEHAGFHHRPFCLNAAAMQEIGGPGLPA